MKIMKKNILAFTILTIMSGAAMAVDRTVSTAGSVINQNSTSLSTLQHTAPVKNYTIDNKGYQNLKNQLISSNSIAIKELYTNYDAQVKAMESSYKNSTAPLVQKLTEEKQTLAKLISEKSSTTANDSIQKINMIAKDINAKTNDLRTQMAQNFYKTNTTVNQKIALANTELLNYAKNNGLSVAITDKITPLSVGVRNMPLSNTQNKIEPQQIIKDIFNSMNNTTISKVAPLPATLPTTDLPSRTIPVQTTTSVNNQAVPSVQPGTTASLNNYAVQSGKIPVQTLTSVN